MPRKSDIMVTNTPDVLTEEVADTAIGLLINTMRELPRAEKLAARRQLGEEGQLSAEPADLARPRMSAFSAWAASALPLPAGWKRSACRSPITTGAVSKVLPTSTTRR